MRTKLGKKSELPIIKQIIDLMPHSVLRRSIKSTNQIKAVQYILHTPIISAYVYFGSITFRVGNVSLGL